MRVVPIGSNEAWNGVRVFVAAQLSRRPCRDRTLGNRAGQATGPSTGSASSSPGSKAPSRPLPTPRGPSCPKPGASPMAWMTTSRRGLRLCRGSSRTWSRRPTTRTGRACTSRERRRSSSGPTCAPAPTRPACSGRSPACSGLRPSSRSACSPARRPLPSPSSLGSKRSSR